MADRQRQRRYRDGRPCLQAVGLRRHPTGGRPLGLHRGQSRDHPMECRRSRSLQWGGVGTDRVADDGDSAEYGDGLEMARPGGRVFGQ